MKSILFVVLSCFLVKLTYGTCGVPCAQCNNTLLEVPEYYWRDYVGIIPADAVPGGKDKTGSQTYIGQVYIQSFELLPATIYPGCLTARASAYNNEKHVDKNIKILCSNNIEKLAWVTTKNEETHLLTNCQFVVGGSEVGQTLHIGRVNHNDEIVIGKIFSNPLGNRGLWVPSNGVEARFLSYDILTYNCNRSNSCANNLCNIQAA